MYWWLNFLPQWSGTFCILQTDWTVAPYTLMPLALLDGEPTGQVGGYRHASPLMIVQ